MSEFEDMASRDHREREPKEGEYYIGSIVGDGRIACYREGLRLVDFYRTPSILAKDVPKEEKP